MRDLTKNVAALLDNFAKEARDRSAAIRERLAAYALDRQEAVAIWRGGRRQHVRLQSPPGKSSGGRFLPCSNRTLSPGEFDPRPRMKSPPRKHRTGSTRSGKRPFDGWGHKGSSDRLERMRNERCRLLSKP